jgi:hypothetical protein
MSVGRAVAVGLFVVGIALGSFTDRLPERLPQIRGGYRVLQGDFHLHTRFSDGFLSPMDVVRCGERQGLDVVGITEHNNLLPSLVARAFSSATGGPIVIAGEEITSRDFHLIALGLHDTISGRSPLPAAIAAVHAQGGVAIAAHPVRRFWSLFQASAAELDGAELMHPIVFRRRSSDQGWSWQDLVEFYQSVHGRPFAAIGSSDYHFFKAVGLCRTFIFADGADEDAVLRALKAGRTVVRDLEGKMYGDPLMVGLLEKEPLPAPAEPSYAPESLLDAVGRTIGWLGLLGLVILGKTRSTRA